MPLLAVGGALAIMMVYNSVIKKSNFVNFQHSPTDPYYVNWSPASLIKELSLYATEGPNYLVWGVLTAIGCLIGYSSWRTDKRDIYILLYNIELLLL